MDTPSDNMLSNAISTPQRLYTKDFWIASRGFMDSAFADGLPEEIVGEHPQSVSEFETLFKIIFR